MMNRRNTRQNNTPILVYSLIGFLIVGTIAFFSSDYAMWGGTYSRNMVSGEKDVSSNWDTESGLNIKWRSRLGSQSYAGPVIFGGKVFVGTNNEGVRNPKHKGDRGVVMAFDQQSGEFLWQIAHPKLSSGRVNDWPLQGVCSTPYVEGDRLWYLSNRCEIVCLDTEGFRDGENDGSYQEEQDQTEIDADVVWLYNMMDELDVFPHNLATSSPLVAEGLVFVVTGNGVDEGHINIPSPKAPSFVAVNKNTGELVWGNASPGEKILHGQWSNPSYGVVNGKPQVLFPGGDGWLYALEPKTGKLIWKFDCNPKDAAWELGGAGTRNNLISTPVIWENKVYLGVGQDPEHGEGTGHFWCIDATKTGDVTEGGLVWNRGGEDFHRTISTAAIADSLVYISDLSGFLYCLDAYTGEHFWTYDAFAAVWGSPYVVDGKVYLGDEDGDVAILKTGKKMELITEINMGSSVYTTPAAKDGVLYVSTRNTLFAIAPK